MSEVFESIVRPTAAEASAIPSWAPQPPPNLPTGFMDDTFVLPEHKTRLSTLLHPHPRDARIQFEEKRHLYFVDGVQCSCSVTAVCHAFSEEFEENKAIALMRKGKNWPRWGYVEANGATWEAAVTDMVADLRRCRSSHSPLMEEALSEAESLVSDIAATRRRGDDHLDEATGEEACGVLRRLVKILKAEVDGGEVVRATVDKVAWSDDRIRDSWDKNRQDAANRGTWFHLQAELWLNRDGCQPHGVEMDLFFKYVQQYLEPLHIRVFRTEWEIFGEEEDLAGSVDFIGQYSDGPHKGKLFIADWKRSKGLRGKTRHPLGRKMASPFSDVEDCQVEQYRCQVNVYKYILEKYYGYEVEGMHIVCVHADNGEDPFVLEVEPLKARVDYLMAWQRNRYGDAILDRFQRRLEHSSE